MRERRDSSIPHGHSSQGETKSQKHMGGRTQALGPSSVPSAWVGCMGRVLDGKRSSRGSSQCDDTGCWGHRWKVDLLHHNTDP